jgi:hypothetical protein
MLKIKKFINEKLKNNNNNNQDQQRTRRRLFGHYRSHAYNQNMTDVPNININIQLAIAQTSTPQTTDAQNIQSAEHNADISGASIASNIRHVQSFNLNPTAFPIPLTQNPDKFVQAKQATPANVYTPVSPEMSLKQEASSEGSQSPDTDTWDQFMRDGLSQKHNSASASASGVKDMPIFEPTSTSEISTAITPKKATDEVLEFTFEMPKLVQNRHKAINKSKSVFSSATTISKKDSFALSRASSAYSIADIVDTPEYTQQDLEKLALAPENEVVSVKIDKHNNTEILKTNNDDDANISDEESGHYVYSEAEVSMHSLDSANYSFNSFNSKKELETIVDLEAQEKRIKEQNDNLLDDFATVMIDEPIMESDSDDEATPKKTLQQKLQLARENAFITKVRQAEVGMPINKQQDIIHTKPSQTKNEIPWFDNN